MAFDSLLPPSASDQERALEATVARISDVNVPIRDAWDPSTCPVALLPWLADAFSVDVWSKDWSEQQKRDTIKNAVYVHRHKGTIGAVTTAIGALGVDAKISEWFTQNPPGPAFTYDLLLDVDQTGISKDTLTHLLEVVDSTKNLRSHQNQVKLSVVTSAPLNVAAATFMGNDILVNYQFDDASLLIEGLQNGDADTNTAVDSLHQLVHVTMPAAGL